MLVPGPDAESPRILSDFTLSGQSESKTNKGLAGTSKLLKTVISVLSVLLDLEALVHPLN